jgi:DNA polymerase-3 subunit gamma/tau
MTLSRAARRKPVLSVEEVLHRLQAMEERLLGGGVSAPPPAISKPVPSPVSQIAEGEEIKEDEGADTEEHLATGEGAEKERIPGALTGEANETWKEFISFAKKKKPPFASILEHGQPLILNEELLEVGYPEKSFYIERMQEPDNLAFLQNLAREFFKRTLKVRVSSINPGAFLPGKGGEGPGGRRNAKGGKEEEALNHPLVREAINIFGGRVVEIKNL